MDKRLAEIIVAAAPKVYLTGFQSQIGEGWAALVLDTSLRLQAACERQQEAGEIPILIIRMQEKRGGLRITAVGVSGEAASIIREAEARSLTICEHCGEPGTLRRDHGYHRTRCDYHDQDYLRRMGCGLTEPGSASERGSQMSERRLKEWVVEAGFGPFDRVLCRAKILHAGWEMDNHAWVVAMPDRRTLGFTTNHGSFVPWSLDDAKEKLEDTLASARSIQEAMGFLAKPP